MPYKTNSDINEKVRNVLPEHAQTIFREAFNKAYFEYGNEQSAFKVAWTAVEKDYKKGPEGKWVKK